MYGKNLYEFFGARIETSSSFPPVKFHRIRQNDKMTLKKPQKLLCEIKKKKSNNLEENLG